MMQLQHYLYHQYLEVPEYTLTTAGTNKDNTYQAPAAKAEDKKRTSKYWW